MKLPRTIALATIASFILLGNFAHAQTTFSGTGLTGDFGTAANWGNGLPSASNSPATIQNGDDATVAGTYTVGQINLGSSSTTGELDVNSGSLSVTTIGGNSHGGDVLLIDGGGLTTTASNLSLQNMTLNMSSGSYTPSSGFSLGTGLTLNQTGGTFNGGPSSNNFMNNGATWKISGGSVNSGSGDVLFFGGGTGNSTLDVIGTGATSINFSKLLDQTGGGTPVLQFDLTAAGVTPINITGGVLTINGTLTINGANYTGGVGLIPLITGASALGQSFNTVNINGITGSIEYLNSGVDLDVTAVPEPSTWALLLTGSLVSLRFIVRRRRSDQI